MESNWINSKWFTKLKEIRFHGNPPNTKLLTYSKIESEVVNIKIDKKFFLDLKTKKLMLINHKIIPKIKVLKLKQMVSKV